VIAYVALAALATMLAASVAVRRMRQRAEAEYRRSLERERKMWRAVESYGTPLRPTHSGSTRSASHCPTQPHTMMTYGAVSDGGSCDSGSASASCGGGSD
jgi:hypothetical protein